MLNTRILMSGLLLGFLLISPAHGQLANLPLDGSADDVSSNAVQVDARSVTWTDEGGRSFAAMPEDGGMLIIPASVSAQLVNAYNFEIQVDFRLTQRADKLDYRQLLSLRALCEEWAFRCPGLGVGFFNNDASQDPFIILNFVDGKHGDIPSHPANEFDDNVRWLQRVPQNEWITVKLAVDFGGDEFQITVGDTVHKGTINNPDRPNYAYDIQAISDVVTSNPIFVGGWKTDESGRSVLPMDLDNVAIYSPAQFQETEIRTALAELTADVNGSASLTDQQKQDHFLLLQSGLPREIDVIRSDVMAFLDAYEAANPPLFESEQRVSRWTLPWEDQAVILLQTHIKNRDFVNGRLDLVEGLAFEAAEVFPGVIDPAEPRLENQAVTWNATYQRNPNITLTASEFVVRPSGYWAPAGEIVQVTMPPEAVDSGVSVIVGAHYRLVTDDLESQNRFQDIGTEFPVNRTDMEVANPFGGGIYLKVPNGTAVGTIEAVISGGVKSAYYSHRAGAQTDVSEWISTVSSTSVPWVDLESDYFMTTVSVDISRGVDNPDEIMDRWDLLFQAHSDLAGRTESNGRAEYYISDRQLVTPAFGAGYPVTIGPVDLRHSISGDFSHDAQWGTWNPFRVLQYRPHSIFLHEMGHNLLIPEFKYPDGASFTSESSVHIWASMIYDTIYGMTPVEAFQRSSHQNMTMDLAAMDWMLTHNFRNDIPMGHDPTIDPSINDQLRYQHRGHGPIVDFAWLFGWDKLGEVYGRFYQGLYPPDHPNFGFVHTRDQLVHASSEVLGVDTSPFWYFWGWTASPEVTADVASRFPQSPAIRQRIEYYRSLIPDDAAGYETWHDQFMALNDGVHMDRWISYRDNYEAFVRDEVQAQFDRIFSMPVDAQSPEVVPTTSRLLSGYPNPFRSVLRIPFELATSASVKLSLVDMLGREVSVLVDGFRNSGSHEISYDGSGLAPGVYMIRLEHDGGSSSRMVTHFR